MNARKQFNPQRNLIWWLTINANFQFDNEEVEDSLFNLESELENLNQLDKRAPYNFGVGKRYKQSIFPLFS